MYIDNSWYGARYIFSKYCKTRDKAVYASIQHGHVLVNEKNLGKKKNFINTLASLEQKN